MITVQGYLGTDAGPAAAASVWMLHVRVALGEPQFCPDCGSPVARERGMYRDWAWKHHLDYCERRWARIEAEDAAIEEELAP